MKTKLQQMTEEEFDKYMAYLIPDYAKDLSENYMIPLEKAMNESKELMDQLLPNKQNSAEQLVYNIYSTDEDKTVGVIWYNIQSDSNKAYIYHIFIKEEFRKKGFATFVLQELEESMKSVGVISMGLNVFGTNPNAYKLYKKLGYQVQSTAMGKRI
ncbi:GCN5-related N-acetyltransferase [Planococcus donghaensis MPA1U2]|uniref:GCN5-related N-acetyltransferase n=1 Tax=Planococcus donghaensis MPA1U2 TaxID=933115 RepID=E7RE23_9BACL|nr:GNAT family N-acetyltransferase [Planococcus donghaensis]EGA90687.1 GCN5-related N-acetyltransferase [Planococcus donghaensis MPA1U2]